MQIIYLFCENREYRRGNFSRYYNHDVAWAFVALRIWCVVAHVAWSVTALGYLGGCIRSLSKFKNTPKALISSQKSTLILIKRWFFPLNKHPFFWQNTDIGWTGARILTFDFIILCLFSGSKLGSPVTSAVTRRQSRVYFVDCKGILTPILRTWVQKSTLLLQNRGHAEVLKKDPFFREIRNAGATPLCTWVPPTGVQRTSVFPNHSALTFKAVTKLWRDSVSPWRHSFPNSADRGRRFCFVLCRNKLPQILRT